MTVCDCKCHQNPNFKGDCGTCGNTGIKKEDSQNRETTLDVSEKPIYSKDAKTLTNAKTVAELSL